MSYEYVDFNFQNCIEEMQKTVPMNALRKAAHTLIENYQFTSSAKLQNPEDFLSYLIYRFPATFAASSFVFEQLQKSVPTFNPKTMIDVGAGPGTASYAAKAFFPTLTSFTLIEKLQGFIDISKKIIPEANALKKNIQDISEQAECVVASYALAELPGSSFDETVRKLYAQAAKCIIFIEPGSQRGFGNILRARTILLEQGAHIVAPCPHAHECPLAKKGDWCHFGVRVQRTSLHKQLKEGTLGYEDEKFSYLVVFKDAAKIPAGDRIVFPPIKNKGHVIFRLCAQSGEFKERIVARSHGDLYKLAKKLSWGDSLETS